MGDGVTASPDQARGARVDFLEAVLRCPRTGSAMRWRGGALVGDGDASSRFEVEDGILKAFLPGDGGSRDITAEIQSFYEDNPFPHYDDMEDLGALVGKSVARGLPEMLNRSIPFGASVLEVGCGTGQLGNFLSIADRRVLSVDICWNSLRLAQGFKERNGLRGVAFGQMNLFRLPLRPAAFDVVICTGVLHHTAAPRRGFEGLVPLVKPGGHVIIGLYNRYARLRTRLRRLMSRLVGDKVLSLDPYARGHAISADKSRAWYMDQYRNPHESLHTMDEVLRWFDAAGVAFVRAIPSTIFGAELELDYARSLFEEEARGSRLDRLLSQCRQMLHDTEGGLFLMIGRKAS